MTISSCLGSGLAEAYYLAWLGMFKPRRYVGHEAAYPSNAKPRSVYTSMAGEADVGTMLSHLGGLL